MEPSLRIKLQAGYGQRTILHDVRFELRAGERLGLLGGSGAGKSTLLLAMLGLLPGRGGWAKGEVLIAGQDMLRLSRQQARSLRGRKIALVPQSPLSALNPALTLQAQLEAAWKAHRKADGRQLRVRVTELLERVALPSDRDFLKRKPGQISVGQAQRYTLALALLHRPSLLIADEPTSSLDSVTQAEVLGLLREISEEQNAALLFVSHDLLSVFSPLHGSRYAVWRPHHGGLAVARCARRTRPCLASPASVAALAARDFPEAPTVDCAPGGART